MNNETNKLTILVADDEISIRTLVTQCFPDYSVVEAEDGAKALELARSCKPDLIFLDIMMPKVDGYAALHNIKADVLTKGIPIVMLTGLSFNMNAKLSHNLGADAYITKPFTVKEITDTVNSLLGASRHTPPQDATD